MQDERNDIYTVETFPYEIIADASVQKRKPGNQGTKERKVYKNLICAFDIETTLLPEIGQSFMYVWQFQVGPDYTVIGRTWDEFKTFRQRVTAQLAKNEWLVVWDHNLSFEFAFISDPDIYDFDRKEVFCMDSRKILKAEMREFRLEFRCSYLHTNMSLDQFLKKMGVEDLKQSGEDFDYSKIRYPWTPLSEKELLYITNDVKGLVEAMTIEMKHDGTNLFDIPRTSTGFVRNDVKRAMRSFNHNTLRYMQPDLHILELLRMAFRGGNTHGNRLLANTVIDGPIFSKDIVSSYPSSQLMREYPMTPFKEVYDHDPDYIMELLNIRHQALLMKVAFSFIRLKEDDWPVPYISKSKCKNLYNGSFDNGRVLAAEYLETAITDIDLRIILEEYDFDEIIFIEVWSSRYGYLPQALRDVTIQYFRDKTLLSGYQRMKAKNKLNSIYGQSVQLPLKPTIEYVNGEYIEKEEDPEEALAKYVKKAHQCYQWGIWITAHSRARLEEGIRLVYEAGKRFEADPRNFNPDGSMKPGKPYHLYCDTDSVKYKGYVDFSEYNKKMIRLAKKTGAYADDQNGVRHYMGVYEDDGEYKQFKTLGAKKYAYVGEPLDIPEDIKKWADRKELKTEGCDLHITISGVSKIKGAIELWNRGGLEAFEDGFVFSDTGKTEVKYFDSDTAYGDYTVDGHTIHIGKNVTILDTTYTLGLTEEYQTLLSDPTIWKRLFTDL